MAFKHNGELTDKTDLSFNTGGDFEIEALSRVTVNGSLVGPKDVTWDMENIGSGRKERFDMEGGRLRATMLRRMPVANGKFGPNALTLKPNNPDCECELKREMRAFFTSSSKVHPGKGSGATPNWFYYWMQTSASGGLHAEYTPVLQAQGLGGASMSVGGRYNYTSDTVYLSDKIIDKVCATRSPETGGGNSKGIDCFAEIIQHENQHKTERWAWWGGTDPTALSFMARMQQDADKDLVPDEVEEQLAGTRGCKSNDPTSCSSRPDGSLFDIEMDAYNVGWSWQRNAADAEDWSCGRSKQWTGGPCYGQ